MGWDDPECRSIGYALGWALSGGDGGAYRLFVFYNARVFPLPFRPPLGGGKVPCRLVDTGLPAGEDVMPDGFPLPLPAQGGFEYLVGPRSAVVLAEE